MRDAIQLDHIGCSKLLTRFWTAGLASPAAATGASSVVATLFAVAPVAHCLRCRTAGVPKLKSSFDIERRGLMRSMPAGSRRKERCAAQYTCISPR
jgi:hypothetical protein